MVWSPIQLVPGLNVEVTPAALRSGYAAMDFGRWKAGLFQKMGGWAKYFPGALDGIPRASHAWEDLANNQRYAAATTTELVDIANGSLTNVTPQTLTTNPAASFTTTAASPIVAIVDAGVVTITPSDSVFFGTPISVDGIILSGLYPVTAYLGAGNYSITAATNAIAGVSAGGAVPAFTTVSGSPNITITLNNHGLIAGDDIVLPIATSVGGLSIVGRYIAASITDANNFVVIASAIASSSAGPTSMNSSNAQLTYYITQNPTLAGGAYGVGNYGAGSYGTGQIASGQAGTPITATDWTVDNWGELLMACPQNGGLYFWGPASGYGNAQVIGTAPYFNAGAFMSNAQQMMICYGSSVDASIGVYQDPLLIRWCDVGDFTAWTGTISNQAGQFRLSQGSRIVGGGATPTMDLIWTDQDLWQMSYVGSQFVFGVTIIGRNCGLIAKHAWGAISGNVYWITPSGLFSMSGGAVSKLACPAWDALYQDLDTANAWQCHVGTNSLFGEVDFFFPSLSGGKGYCDKKLTLNIDEGLWSLSSVQRNTWIDLSGAGNPISINNQGIIYQHETGMNADTGPMKPYFETGWIRINSGEDIAFLDRIMPDFKWGEYNGTQNASILITVSVVKWLNQVLTPATYGPFTINDTVRFISKRIRGRYLKFRVESQDTDSFWRLGNVEMRWSADGKN